MATDTKKAAGKTGTVANQTIKGNAIAATVSHHPRPTGRSDEHSQQLWLKFTKDPGNQQLRNQLNCKNDVFH